MLSDYGIAPVFKEVVFNGAHSMRGSADAPGGGGRDVHLSSYDAPSNMGNPAGMSLNTN